jgi:hypothetical protein
MNARTTRWLVPALAITLIAATLPTGVWADTGAAGTAEEERGYAAREAAARPSLGLFEGGFHGVVLAIAIIIAVVAIVHFVVFHVHVHPPPPPPPPRPVP